MPPLADYLVAAEATVETPRRRAGKLRAALEVLSAQYGIPLRPRTGDSHGE